MCSWTHVFIRVNRTPSMPLWAPTITRILSSTVIICRAHCLERVCMSRIIDCLVYYNGCVIGLARRSEILIADIAGLVGKTSYALFNHRPCCVIITVGLLLCRVHIAKRCGCRSRVRAGVCSAPCGVAVRVSSTSSPNRITPVQCHQHCQKSDGWLARTWTARYG